MLVFPIIVLFIIMEYSLRKIPNDYSNKKNYLDNHSGEIQILIFGSSNTYFGLNPVYFSHNAFNISHVTQSLDFDLKILKKYQDRFNSLNIIILPISYPTLWHKLENSIESWRAKNYTIYYGINTNLLTNNFELLSNPLSKNIERLMKYYLEKENDIACNTLGWGMIYKSENAVDLHETAKLAAKRHTVDIFSEENIKLFDKNLKVLNSFSEFCSQRNISLIFLTTPTCYTYREKIDYGQLNKMMNTINDFVKNHSNCYYFNFFENTDFVTEDFFDADHLNEIGAEKLSLMINEMLIKINSSK